MYNSLWESCSGNKTRIANNVIRDIKSQNDKITVYLSPLYFILAIFDSKKVLRSPLYQNSQLMIKGCKDFGNLLKTC